MASALPLAGAQPQDQDLHASEQRAPDPDPRQAEAEAGVGAVMVVTHGEAVACAALWAAPWATVYEVGGWGGRGGRAGGYRDMPLQACRCTS